MSSAVLGGQPLGSGDVLGDERRIEGDGRGLPPDRLGGARDVLRGQSGVRSDAPGVGLFVVLPERVGIGGQRPLCECEHGGQHLLDLERTEDRRRGFEKQPQAVEVLGVRPLGIDWRSSFDVLSGHGTPGIGRGL
jgi:hypothetical protein